MAATDFGRALHERLKGRAELVVRRRGKSATGLARPDFFDWKTEARRQLARHRPELVVVIIGGNDGQDLLGGKPRRVRWTEDAWETAYAERMEAWLSILSDDAREVLWVELPVMARPRLEKKLQRIRAVQRAVIEAHPRARWVATRDHFFDGPKLRTKIPRGSKIYPLRQEDGIHFTRPGAAWFADQVLPDLLARVR